MTAAAVTGGCSLFLAGGSSLATAAGRHSSAYGLILMVGCISSCFWIAKAHSGPATDLAVQALVMCSISFMFVWSRLHGKKAEGARIKKVKEFHTKMVILHFAFMGRKVDENSVFVELLMKEGEQ